MKIVVNGREVTTPDRSTVSLLLEQLDLSPLRVAVELNGRIVPKGDYAGETLSNDDRLEIVQFVGGG